MRVNNSYLEIASRGRDKKQLGPLASDSLTMELLRAVNPQ
jgi:hypothetical protein